MSPRSKLLVHACSALTAVLAALLSPAAAVAGSYDVVACGSAANGVNRTWVAENNDTAHLESPAACPGWAPYSGLTARTRLNSGSPLTGARAHWIFRAPAGTRISRVRLDRWLGMEGGSGWRPFGRQADGTILAGETCDATATAYECNVGGWGAAPSDHAVDTTSIAYGIECTGVHGCSTGATIHEARAAIYSARVTLSESSPPTVDAPTGPLVATGGYHRGTETVTFGGADPTSGLSALRVYVDGVQRAEQALPCDHTYAVPCASAPPRTLSVDLAGTGGGTRLIPDGEREVQVAAVDAAGNETRSAVRRIVVDGTPPAAPANLATSTGSGWQTSPELSVAWDPLAGQVAPIAAAHWTLCRAGSSTGCVEGSIAVDGDGPLPGVGIPGEGAWDLSVRLEDAAGNTSADAVARTTVRYDATAPAASPNLEIGTRRDADPAFLAWFNPPPDQVAPVTEAIWALCPADGSGGCVDGRLATDPHSTNYLRSTLPRNGDWVLSVRLRDAAGNLGAPARIALRHALAAPPAPAPGAPAADPPPATGSPAVRVDPRLRLREAWLDASSRVLGLRGTLAAAARGPLRLRIEGVRAGRTRALSRTVRSRGGRFSARLTLPRAMTGARLRVSVRYGGSVTHLPAAARRAVTRRS